MPTLKANDLLYHYTSPEALNGIIAKLGIDPIELLRMINGQSVADQSRHRRIGEGVGF